MTNEELWRAVLGEMELSLSRANFSTWFKNTLILSKDDQSVIVSVPNGFIKEWLENKFNRRILDSIRGFSPEVREIKYVVGTPKIELRTAAKSFLDRNLDDKPVIDSSKDVDRVTNLNRK